MTTTLDERGIGHLASLLNAIRPDFDVAGCVAALRKLPDLPASQIVIAAVRYAADEHNLTPAHIADLGNRAWDSDWHQPCPKHPNNRRYRTSGECADCFAERVAAPYEGRKSDPDRKQRPLEDALARVERRPS